jgi:hypothetical protein
LNQGIQDALKTLAREVKISKNIQTAYNEVDLFISNAEKQNANRDLIHSAQSVEEMLQDL